MAESGGATGWSVGTPTQFRWLDWIVRAVLLLNLLDTVFTLFWVQTGIATEANILLADIVERHGVLFVVVKLGLVSLGTVLLWRNRTRPLAVIGIFVAFLAYYFVLLYHLQFASQLIRGVAGG
jgi:hypothetical protein